MLIQPIPGEVLVGPQRRLKVPGYPYRDPVWHTTRKLLFIVLAAFTAWPVWDWLTTAPEAECITVSEYSPDRLDYHDDMWLLDGHLIGFAPTEDATCIHPV